MNPPPSPPVRHQLSRGRWLAVLLILAIVVAGCGVLRNAGAGAAGVRVAASPSVGPGQEWPEGQAPSSAYPVGSRTITANRGTRVLATTIWYPKARSGAVAGGRFPVVMFSHGLHGAPIDYVALTTRWAAAGFIVVAPVFPHTSRAYKDFDIADVLNQPADVCAVLTAVLALDTTASDPLAGHLRTDRVAAAGHSAGAITTVGLFVKQRDARLSAAIVLAGNAFGMGNAFSGDPAAMLFVHGDKDSVTPYALGHATYAAVPAAWPAGFLTLTGQGHLQPFSRVGTPAFSATAAVTTDFLRWTLYGDAAARARIPGEVGAANTWESRRF